MKKYHFIWFEPAQLRFSIKKFFSLLQAAWIWLLWQVIRKWVKAFMFSVLVHIINICADISMRMLKRSFVLTCPNLSSWRIRTATVIVNRYWHILGVLLKSNKISDPTVYPIPLYRICLWVISIVYAKSISHTNQHVDGLWPLLLTWFNFNPTVEV